MLTSLFARLLVNSFLRHFWPLAYFSTSVFAYQAALHRRSAFAHAAYSAAEGKNPVEPTRKAFFVIRVRHFDFVGRGSLRSLRATSLQALPGIRLLAEPGNSDPDRNADRNQATPAPNVFMSPHSRTSLHLCRFSSIRPATMLKL